MVTKKKPMKRRPVHLTGEEAWLLRVIVLTRHIVPEIVASDFRKGLDALLEKKLVEQDDDMTAEIGRAVMRASDLGIKHDVAWRATLEDVEQDVIEIARIAEYDPEAATSRERELHARVLLACALRPGEAADAMAEAALQTTYLRFRRC
jgi:hypothetical protein